jgi:hypothetical protein
MKKRFLTTVILAAAATILIGGCEQQGAGEDGERGGNFSGTVTDEQVYVGGEPFTEPGTYTLRMYAFIEGTYLPYGDDVGTFADGKLSFTLPDTIEEGALTAVFDEFSEGSIGNPPDYKALFVPNLWVYDGDEAFIGRLFYGGEETSISFLYSPGPFTVTGVDSNNDVNLEIAVGTGWNTVLWDDNDGSCIIGTPPTGAEWQFLSMR